MYRKGTRLLSTDMHVNSIRPFLANSREAQRRIRGPCYQQSPVGPTTGEARRESTHARAPPGRDSTERGERMSISTQELGRPAFEPDPLVSARYDGVGISPDPQHLPRTQIQCHRGMLQRLVILILGNRDKRISLPPILRAPVAIFSFWGSQSVIGSPEGSPF